MPKIVAIEEINGRLMVEIDQPSGDGSCRILSQEEMADIDKKLEERSTLLDALWALLDALREAAMKLRATIEDADQ